MTIHISVIQLLDSYEFDQVSELRALGQQNREKRVGRPKLPKGEAKGRIVPVRFTGEDLKAMAAAAKASKQTLSEWIRRTIHGTLQ
ncbi:MAG: hypothetical protein JO356_03505 [Acidobacteria bacterium]|nr:hypothetical protein [Acidobacteriota bacterium]